MASRLVHWAGFIYAGGLLSDCGTTFVSSRPPDTSKDWKAVTCRRCFYRFSVKRGAI